MSISWKCDVSGCFAEANVPNHNIWDDCYPGKISMTDIDQIAELSGWLFGHEWKSETVTEISTAQLRAYSAMVEQIKKKHVGASKNTVIFLYGHTGKSIIDRFELMIDVDGYGAMRGPICNYGSSQKNYEMLCQYKIQWALDVAYERMRRYLMEHGFSEEEIVKFQSAKFDFMPVLPND